MILDYPADGELVRMEILNASTRTDNPQSVDLAVLASTGARIHDAPAAARRAKKKHPFLGGAASDFEALEKLGQLGFGEKVPEPAQGDLFSYLEEAVSDSEAEGEEGGE